jgi:hypothetical protein
MFIKEITNNKAFLRLDGQNIFLIQEMSYFPEEITTNNWNSFLFDRHL